MVYYRHRKKKRKRAWETPWKEVQYDTGFRGCNADLLWDFLAALRLEEHVRATRAEKQRQQQSVCKFKQEHILLCFFFIIPFPAGV